MTPRLSILRGLGGVKAFTIASLSVAVSVYHATGNASSPVVLCSAAEAPSSSSKADGDDYDAHRSSYVFRRFKSSSDRAALGDKHKIIHLVRHAEGHHNVAGEQNYADYLREEFEDAHLTSKGVAQCKALFGDTQANHTTAHATLLVVSPMRRTLQTATYSFPNLIHQLEWVAIEELREQSGLHPCDRRRSITELQKYYPHVAFEVEHDEDPIYSKHTQREPRASVVQRCLSFLDYIAKRPEKEIIVVTHSAYLQHLLRDLVITEPDDDTAVIKFNNCELRTYIMSKNELK